jgi:hypothetical protein
MEPVTQEDLLAALQQEQDAKNAALEEQILQSQAVRQQVGQNTLDGIAAGAQIQNDFIQNSPALNSVGLAGFTDDFTGSNISRASEALVNQRALLASGTDAGSRLFRDQLDQANGIPEQEALSFKDQLKLDLDNQKAAGKQRTDAIRLQLQAQKDEENARLKAEKEAFDRDLKLRQQSERERLNAARINKINTPAAKTSGASSSGNTRGGLFNFLGGIADSQAGGTSASRAKRFEVPLQRIQKVKQDELANSARARTALAILNDDDPKGNLRRVGVGAIQNMLARASGEVGALTEGDKAAFRGRQGVFDRIRRTLSIGTFSDLTDEDIEGLKLLAETFINGANIRASLQARSSIGALKAGLGVTDDELLDNGILEFVGDGATAEALGLVDNRAINAEIGAARSQQPAALEGPRVNLAPVEPSFSTLGAAQPDPAANANDAILDGLGL